MKNGFKNKKEFTRTLKLVSGFTLIETLFGVSIFVLIVLAMTIFSRNIFIYNSFISSGLSNIDVGRQALKVMTAEIRTASSGSDGSYAISQATGTSFIFYSDINDNGLKERVRYFLNGSLLQKGVVTPTGAPLSYNLANEKITTLLSSVTSSSVFYYYDENYDGTTAALSSPVDISVVRLVKITAVVNKDPSRTPPFTFSTQVSLRNLKDNL